MNAYIKKTAIFSLLLLAYTGCKKPDLAGMNSTGEGLVPFTLSSPSSGATVVLNAATPTATIDFTWTASLPGLKTAPTYTWVAALRTGSLDTPLVSLPAGLDTKFSPSYQRLDSALKAKGIAAGAQTNLMWSILADNGSTKLLATNVYNISITRFQDGASPFVLLGPSSSTSPTVINPGSTTDSLRFNWTRSTSAGTANGLSYKVWFYKDDAGSTPVFSMPSNNNGKDSVLSMAYAQLSDSLNAHGMTDVSQVSQLKWTVDAISGSWNQWSNYTNQLYLLREIDLYLAGSFQSTQWDPPTGIQMIGDNRSGLQNKLYWIYIYLPANTEFKITQGRSWDINFGDGGSGNLAPNGNTNFKVTNAGVYRISADIGAKTYDISTGRMGFVGGAVTNVGWTPSNVFPTAQMHFTGTNQFMGVYSFTSDAWKMIDSDHWYDGSNSVAEVRSYGSKDGSTFEINGPDNMPNIPAPDTYKITWDGSDLKNLKYTAQTWHMYLIGDATAGGWDNNNAALPQLTYQGNGIWKITGVTLTGGFAFKFLMVKGTWDYNYGGPDPNTNPLAGGSIQEGGGNIQVPVTGTYTVTLDEYNRTYTVQ